MGQAFQSLRQGLSRFENANEQHFTLLTNPLQRPRAPDPFPNLSTFPPCSGALNSATTTMNKAF